MRINNMSMGSCGLRTIHDAFKTGAEQTDWNMKMILKAAYQTFHDPPVRSMITLLSLVPISFFHHFMQQGW